MNQIFNSEDCPPAPELSKDEQMTELQKKENSDILNILNQDNEYRTEMQNVIGKKTESKESIQKRVDEIKSEAFNEDGSINPEKLGDLIASGKYDFHDFADALNLGMLRMLGAWEGGYEDGTRIFASDGHGEEPMGISVETPDGQWFEFDFPEMGIKDTPEYDFKKDLQ